MAEEDYQVAPMEPASPSAQYLNSSVLSLSIIAVLESDVPLEVDDSVVLSKINDVFLPINRRFSSIMVTEKKGVKKWKQVRVNLSDHLRVPTYPSEKSLEFYDECLSEYLTNLALEPFPPNRPLWEIHIFRYPTSNAAGNCIFKLHHSLGDGYSLMGALLSCLQRADNPALPLTFPCRERSNKAKKKNAVVKVLKAVPRFFTGVVHTVSDFSWSFLKSSFIDDDATPVHSHDEGVEFRPVAVTTTAISLAHLKQIKSRLNVTINDVIAGIIMYGTRLYMKEVDEERCNGKCTSLVLFNTRAIGGYKSVSEMIKPDAEMPWGNRFTFLPVSIPKLTPADDSDPLRFVRRAHRMVKRQRNSAAVYLTSQLLELNRKLRGPEATAQLIRGTLRNTTMVMTNMIGPVEETTLVHFPVKGMYFFVAGAPQSLSVTMVSYVGKLRLTIVAEKGFVDENKMKSCIQFAFDKIYKLAVN